MSSAANRREDLTARSRIREAALRLFAELGFDATPVRAIAAAAEVPVGLVNYHFGSKDGLREAVDDWVIEYIGEEKGLVAAGGSLPQLQAYLADHAEMRPVFDYFVMSLRTGGRPAAHLFDRMVELTRDMLSAGADAGSMRRYPDPDAVAVILVAYGIGASLMGDQLARHFGGEALLDEPVYQRYAAASAELHTHALFTDERFLAALAPLDAAPDPRGAASPEPNPSGE